MERCLVACGNVFWDLVSCFEMFLENVACGEVFPEGFVFLMLPCSGTK